MKQELKKFLGNMTPYYPDDKVKKNWLRKVTGYFFKNHNTLEIELSSGKATITLLPIVMVGPDDRLADVVYKRGVFLYRVNYTLWEKLKKG